MNEGTSTPAAAPEAAQPEAKAPETQTESTEQKGAPAPASEEQKAAERKRYKVKIEGNEQEVDEDELVAGYQSRKASQRAWQEAAQVRKQITETFRKIKVNPIEGLQELLKHPELGIDLRQVAKDMLVSEIEREQMTPEQRELADTRKELEAYRREKEEAERARVDEETAALRRDYAAKVEQEIVDAITPSGLPMSKFTFKRVVFYLKEGHKRGYKLTAADVVPLVRKDYEEEHRSFFSSYDDDKLESVLGDQVAERLSKRRIAKLKGQLAPDQRDAAPQGADTQPEAKEPRAQREKPKSGPPETFAQVAKRIAGRK